MNSCCGSHLESSQQRNKPGRHHPQLLLVYRLLIRGLTIQRWHQPFLIRAECAAVHHTVLQTDLQRMFAPLLSTHFMKGKLHV